jgi:predicted aminopeptidase
MMLYLSEQATGQAKIIFYSEPVSEILNNTNVADSVKKKLLFVKEILDFTQEYIGIDAKGNYSVYYDQKNKPILWVVTACEKYSFNEYRWKYPFLGKLTYKGFFDFEKAQKEEMRLKSIGYDTNSGSVNAWSTLGWFKDPILSEMLKKTEAELARLLIHELTHTVLYVKGNATLSENIATFIGDKGALFYLEHKYGKNSNEVMAFSDKLSDIDKLSKHLFNGYNLLDSLYNTFNNAQSDLEKESAKKTTIERIIADADSISFKNKNNVQFIFKKEFSPNNTFFTGYKMYREKQSEMQKTFEQEFDNDFKKYLIFLKEEYG